MTPQNPAGSADSIWVGHARAWRDPLEAVSLVQNFGDVDPKLFRAEVQGDWWEVLAELGITLFVSREYEHLILAFSVVEGQPRTSYFPLPHPSGLAYHPGGNELYIASTRNPNQVFTFQPVTGILDRQDLRPALSDSDLEHHPLLPVRSRFLPGCTYLHDLALIGDDLYANAVAHNAVIRIDEGGYQRVWWPACIERDGIPDFGQNYLQLNSIAAGADIAASFFSASTDRMSARRPGHKNFKVDRRGVIFSGETREPLARGLTRPHSARLHRGCLWVDNSGYGELGFVEGGVYQPYLRLPGWTRGLWMAGPYAFVGTSRVLPRFHHYAPGLDLGSSVCGVHIVDLDSARVVGSLCWPYGNQVFSFEAIDSKITSGFLSKTGGRRTFRKEKDLYYRFKLSSQ